MKLWSNAQSFCGTAATCHAAHHKMLSTLIDRLTDGSESRGRGKREVGSGLALIFFLLFSRENTIKLMGRHRHRHRQRPPPLPPPAIPSEFSELTKTIKNAVKMLCAGRNACSGRR